MYTASTSSEEQPPGYLLKQRKRNGSLRKTALLGTRKLKSDPYTHSSVSRSRRSSNSLRRELELERESVLRATGLGLSGDDNKTVGDGEKESVIVDGDGNDGIVEDEFASSEPERDEILGYGEKVDKVTSNASVSSTDDDDILLFGSRKVSSVAGPSKTTNIISSKLTLSPSSPSSSATTKSSLNFPVSDYTTLPAQIPESSDSTTAFYGYIILFLTWGSFITGLGSCFDIWTWAWDVGTTPPAPPELHDDETLPITGYYPTLLILTGGVVSWVWCGFAWMGMKYFRHAKEGEG